MRRSLATSVVLAFAVAGSAHGQAGTPRSADYLFVTNAADVRTTWVNPAGLGVVNEASVMAEFTLARPPGEDVLLGQWTLAFNSRGLSLGLLRDRARNAPSVTGLRLGVGLPFRHGALGFAVTHWDTDSISDRGADVGIRYTALPSLQLGAVMRDIGRPEVRGGKRPLAGAAGATWWPAGPLLQVSAEATGTERLGASGLDMSYRAGAALTTQGRLPVALLTTLRLDQDVTVAQWTLGVVIGGRDRVVAASSWNHAAGTNRFSAFSVTGVASRLLTGRPF